MQISKGIAAAAVLAVVGLSGTVFAQGAAAQKVPSSAYESVDNVMLGKKLSAMGMGEMLAVLVKQMQESNPGSTELKMVNSYLLTMRAGAPGVSVEQRENLYDQAVKEMRSAIEDVEKSITDDSPGELYERNFKNLMELAELQGMTRLASYTDKLAYLIRDPEGEKIIAKNGEEAVKIMDSLLVKLEDTRRKWNAGGKENLARLVDVPLIDDLIPQAKYKAAWIGFFYAMGLPDDEGDTKTKGERLGKVIDQIGPFIEDKTSGFAERSQLLRGRAYREKKEFEPAANDLDTVVKSPATPSGVKVLAIFEQARNAAEYGDYLVKQGIKEGKDGPGKLKIDKGKEYFKVADKATEEFPKVAAEIPGNKQIGIDLKWAVLHDYLYGLWSQALLSVDPNDPEGKEVARKSSLGMETLLSKYPQAAKSIMELFGGKKNFTVDNSSPGMVVITARQTLAKDKEEIKKSGELQQAIDSLQAVVNKAQQGDLAAQGKKGDALMALGEAYNIKDNPVVAAELFRRVVVECPDDKKNAALAAFRAVSMYKQLVSKWQKDTGAAADDAPTDYRIRLIDCIEAMLKLWEASPTPEKRKEDFASLLQYLPSREQNLGVYYLDLGLNKEALSQYTPEELAEGYVVAAQKAAAATATSRPTTSSAPATPTTAPTSQPVKSPEQWRVEAIAAYDKYPADCPDKVMAEFYSLQLQYEPFNRMDVSEKPKHTEEAKAMLAKLDSFVAAVKKGIQDNPQEIAKVEQSLAEENKKEKKNADQIDYLTLTIENLKELPKWYLDWGSIMDYNARVLEYEALQQEDIALQKVAAMPAAWPGTEILRYSRDFEIRKLVDKGRVKEAIQKVRDFQKDYSAKDANDLIGLTVTKIRAKIRELGADPARADERKNYVDAYSEFAKTLYDGGVEANSPPDKLLPLKQMYADSLLIKVEYLDESARPAVYQEAMKMFKDCSDVGRQTQKDMFTKFVADAKTRLSEAKKLVDFATPDQLKKAAEDYYALRNTVDNSKDETGQEASLNAGLRYMGNKADAPEAERKKIYKQVGECVVACYDDVIQRGEATIDYLDKPTATVSRAVFPTTSDANNIRGLARCNAALKNYKVAAEYYGRLVSGLNPKAFKDLYWDAQVEYAECLYDYYKSRQNEAGFKYRDAMDGLAMRMRQILNSNEKNPDMRHYKGRLTNVLTNAERESSKTPAASEAPAAQPTPEAPAASSAESQPAAAVPDNASAAPASDAQPTTAPA